MCVSRHDDKSRFGITGAVVKSKPFSFCRGKNGKDMLEKLQNQQYNYDVHQSEPQAQFNAAPNAFFAA